MVSSSTAFQRFACSRTALRCTLATITAAFVATHMQYWVEHPIPAYSPDSRTYLAVAFDIARGVRPSFDFRTPGYPLFLYAILETTGSILAVVLSQQLFTLFSAYLLSVAAFLTRPSLVLVSLLPSLALVGSPQGQLYELWILPETMYATSLVLVFACLLVGFPHRSKLWLGFASGAMGMAILFRPSGLFLIGTYLLVLVAMWRTGFRRGQAVSFAAPLPALLLALCGYNYATIGQFTVSPFGQANLAGATTTFWREVPGFPDSVNVAIRQSQEDISPEDRITLRSEWNVSNLSPVYARYYGDFLWYRLIPALESIGARGMGAQAPYFARMSRVAIAQDPVAYAKFVYTSLYVLLSGTGSYESPDQGTNYRTLYGQPRYLDAADPAFRRFALREYEVAPFTHASPKAAALLAAGRTDSPAEETFWVSIARQYDRYVYRPLYVHARGWAAILCGQALLSALVLIRVRRAEASTMAWLGLITPLSTLGALLLIALVEEGLIRYVYPTRFLFYLSPLLMAAIYLQLQSQKTESAVSRSAPTS